MEIRLAKTAGLTNEAVVLLPQDEIAAVRLSVPHWDQLANGDGMVRWKSQTHRKSSEAALKVLKHPVEAHLRGMQLTDEEGHASCPVVCIGNRNLGNNLGFVAWEAGPPPRVLRLRSEPPDRVRYSCLCCGINGRLSIQSLGFGKNEIWGQNEKDAISDLTWCTSGMRILESGRIRHFEEMVEDAYDIRHLLAIDGTQPAGQTTLAKIYGEANEFDLRGFVRRAIDEWRLGVPRSRYFHSCVGVSTARVVLLMAEGTPEQLSQRLRAEGCDDGLILDQGGSSAVWASWVYRSEDGDAPRGGFLQTSVDYRPNATSVIAFSLHGQGKIRIPGGSASSTCM